MPRWTAAVWGCCYWEASYAGAWGNFSVKSRVRAWETPISLRSWTSPAATGFPARISQDPRSARGLDNADYPLQGLLRCPGLSSAEPFSRSTLYTWQWSRATWLPGLFPVTASLGLPGRGPGKQVGANPAASSFGRLPQSLGGDGAGSRVGERAPRRKPRGRHPPLPILPRLTAELAGQRNMEGSHGERGFCQRYETAC